MRTFENYHNVYLYIEPLTDDDPDLKKRYQISNTLKYLENYLNITTNQYNRIVENMSTYEEFMVILTIALLIVAILNYKK